MNITWVSAEKIGEAITQSIARDYKRSRPTPRDWAMGFKGEKRRNRREDEARALARKITS